MDKILVLDFGGQTTQLIARRIRDIGVYSEILPGNTVLSSPSLQGVKGLVFSGSPYSVYEVDSPEPDESAYAAGLPILGICYGFHQISRRFGAKVEAHETTEYGRSPVAFLKESRLFKDVPDGFVSWMSHGDSIAELPEPFRILAKSNSFVAAAEREQEGYYGIQFHPEVTHCEYGREILENFSIGICGASKEWNMDRFLDQAIGEIREGAGDRDVLLLISGGVDSMVVAGLLLRSLKPEKVHLLYIDTGLMRKNETPEIEENLSKLGARNLYVVDASVEYLTALEEVTDPEKKRTIIGDIFVRIQDREIKERGIGDALLAQGTLYPDMIESGKGVGKHAHIIKSHHNVRSPLIEAKRKAGQIIEPLRLLYKDEVRTLGGLVGLEKKVIGRHPFPGPGLAVRILGELTKEKCDVLREADAIFIEELRTRGLYDQIWQAFCVLLPIRSVGVTGDVRKYGYVLSLRAVISRDAMTADVYPFEPKALLEISSRITNTVSSIGRVVYDISSKPPATIEWE